MNMPNQSDQENEFEDFFQTIQEKRESVYPV